MRNFLDSVQLPYLVKCVKMGRETSMETEDIILNNSGQWEIIKQVCEILPHIRTAILSDALIVEPVDLCDLSTFVISSEDCDSVSESHLESDEKGDSLEGVVASVDIITHEEVIGVWAISANSKKLHEIMVLPMDVPTDGDGGFHLGNIALIL